MAKPKLNDQQKARVVELHDQGMQQQKIAAYFNISTRSVYRVLEEQGRITTRRFLSDREKDFLALMHDSGLTVPEAREKLKSLPLTPHNVREVLVQMSSQELGAYFMGVLRDKLVRESQAQAQRDTQARAGNGQMEQESLYG